MSAEPAPGLRADAPALRACVEILSEYRGLIERDRPLLHSLAGSCEGEVVFCLGNGPSLARQDPQLLSGKNVIATNHGYRFLQDVRPARVLNLVTDTVRLGEVGAALTATGWPIWCAPHRLTREWLDLAHRWPEFRVMPTTQFIGWSRGDWEIAPREVSLCGFRLPGELEHCAQSVIFAAIQLAVYLGARVIVLLGVDMDYSGPQGHFIPGVAHLNPGYDYETHARSSFVHCRRALEPEGLRLLNATDGGRVDVLERISLEQSSRLADRLAAQRRISLANASELTAWRARALADQVPLDRPVILWGANKLAAAVDMLLAQRGHAVVGVVDRQSEGDGHPDVLFARLEQTRPPQYPFFVICSRNARDAIATELAQRGVVGPDQVAMLPELDVAVPSKPFHFPEPTTH